ncbi:MAG: sigma-70 family RNA polymerase sigma factor [bacterium]|nr:sigma-70 family RNA polymerase sigma factor [bacterium]
METQLTAKQLLAEDDWIRGLARSLLRDEALVDDLVQEGYMAFLTSRTEIRQFRPWMKGTLRNIAKQLLFRERFTVHEGLEWTVDETISDPEQIMHRESVRTALVELTLELEEPYSSVIIAHYFHGHEQKRIAKQLGRTESAVRTQLMRAREKLREKAKKRGIDDQSLWSHLPWLVGLRPKVAPVAGPAALGTGVRSAIGIAVVGGIAVLVVSAFRLEAAGREVAAAVAPVSTPDPDGSPDLAETGAPSLTREGSAPNRPTESGPSAPTVIVLDNVDPAAGIPVRVYTLDESAMFEHALRARPDEWFGEWLDERAVAVTLTSDAEGTVTLPAPEDEQRAYVYVVRVASSDHLRVTEVLPLPKGVPREGLRILLETESLVGSVPLALLGPDQRPVAKAEVRVFNESFGLNVPVDVGGSGHLEIRTAKGTGVVAFVRAPGLAHARITIQPDMEPTWKLVPARTVTVRVVDAGGYPVAGARVRCPRSPFSSVTNANGVVDFSGLPARGYVSSFGDSRLEVVHPNHARIMQEVADGADEVEIRLAPRRWLEGTLIAESGVQLERTEVTSGKFRGELTVHGEEATYRVLDDGQLEIWNPDAIPPRLGRRAEDGPLLLRRGFRYDMPLVNADGTLLPYRAETQFKTRTRMPPVPLRNERYGAGGYRVFGVDPNVPLDIEIAGLGRSVRLQPHELRSAPVHVPEWPHIEGTTPPGLEGALVYVGLSLAGAPPRSWTNVPVAEGQFDTLRSGALLEELYVIHAFAPEHVPFWSEVGATRSFSPDDLEITFEPATKQVVLVDVAGHPAPNQAVRIVGPPLYVQPGASWTTDPLGQLELWGRPGDAIDIEVDRVEGQVVIRENDPRQYVSFTPPADESK